MRKTIATLIGAAALAGAAPAIANTGASLSFPTHGAFTLHQAHNVAVKHELRLGVGGYVGRCHWRNQHQAACDVTALVPIIDGLPADQMSWEDIVTRSGPCENAGRIVKRVHGITYQDGGHHQGNCFTGPLVVLQGA